MKASKQLSYPVLKGFRFAGRQFEPGSVFHARRMDPRRLSLQRWIDEGILQHPDAEAESELELEVLESEGSEFLEDESPF